MLSALNGEGVWIDAAPGRAAFCPGCRQPLIPRCGQIVSWHFAHRSGADCDDWAESENAWTASWKEEFAIDRRDVWIRGRRADIVSARGRPVLLRHSPTTADEIEERERHFGRMVWIFDLRDAYADDRLHLRVKRGQDPGDRYRTFRWKHARTSLAFARQTVLLDLGMGSVLWLRRMHPEAPVGGWGYLGTRAQVVSRLHRA